MNNKKTIRTLFIVFAIFLLIQVMLGINKQKHTEQIASQTTYSAFLKEIEGNQIKSVTITEKANGPRELAVINKEDQKSTIIVPDDTNLIPKLIEHKVEISAIAEDPPNAFLSLLLSFGPVLLLIAVWIYFAKKSSGGKSGLFQVGKSKAQLIDPNNLKISFSDVVGCDEAKEEVQEFVDFLKNPEKFNKVGGQIPRGVLLTGPAGTGKAQPLYSNIRVPNGWEKMENIKINDYVCNPDGGYSKVIGIFPQGLKNNYRITFDDGSISESCDEHLWCVKFSDLHKDYRNYTLKQIKEKMDKGYYPRLYPISKIDSPEIDLPINPYLLGIILGDGCITTSHNVVSISSADIEIINNVKLLIGDDYQLVEQKKYAYNIVMKNKVDKYLCRLGVFQNKFTQALWDMGLCGKYSHEKFIPQMYLHASYEQRLALLQGLMDTDGTIEKTNFTYYSTTSKELAEDIVELARSLGMISYINSSKLKSYSYKGSKHIANHVCYNVTIKSYEPSILFRLERKFKIAKTRKFIPTKSITKIEYIGQTEMQCIMLDSVNHLYVTDGYNTTHNTLIAKALAKESGVPFLSLSGSEFVEMFVGVGASRVRDLFETAKKHAPCVIFIDEIDAVGGARSSGNFGGGGHDEREQTLNQLLVELDGFETNKGIILVGATNRPESLDKALLRPGRIDRQIVVGLPDVYGREEILKIHARNVPLATGVDLAKIARGTPGFSGAELANLINEAAILTARYEKKFVEQVDLEKAKDKIMMGVERPSLAMSISDKRDTAYHESGHAIVARLVKNADPVHKVTIIPRGRALGVTMQLPEQDRWSYKAEYLKDKITILMGGRAAEEIFCNTRTNGASNDISVATNIAKSMVLEWGMSELGPIAFGNRENNSFLSNGELSTSGLSQSALEKLETEIHGLLNSEYKRAKQLLEENRDIVEAMTEALMESETIDDWQIENLMQRRPYNDQAGLMELQEQARKKEIEIEKMRKKPKFVRDDDTVALA